MAAAALRPVEGLEMSAGSVDVVLEVVGKSIVGEKQKLPLLSKCLLLGFVPHVNE